MLDEYGPIIKYIKVTDNDKEDVLSIISLIISDVTDSNITRENLAEIYCVYKLDGDTFPLKYQNIEKYQRKYRKMIAKMKRAKYHTKYVCGGGKVTKLICKGNKIIMITILLKFVVRWYHAYLIHPVMYCNEATISQHYY